MFSQNEKPILQRCRDDASTRLRLKYTPYYRVVDSGQGANIVVDDRPMVMMSSNDYLGLSQHPELIAASKRATDTWGTVSPGSRLANGSRSYHIELEEAIASFLGKEACHVMAAGYLSCVCSLSSLAHRGDAVIVDKSIHASLWDGALLSGATIERFTHEDMDSLAQLLSSLDPEQPKVIVVDGIYSMEGHFASLPKVAELAEQFRAVLVVDDAHGVGIIGRDGRGVADHLGVTEKVDLIAGSFSKSLASTGGFVAGSKTLIEYLRSNSRQIIFSAALGPSAAASALTALRVIQAEPEHRERLWENVKHLREILDGLGLDYWNSPSPALPIVLGDKEKCYWMWKSLWDQGFFTVMSISPGVPIGKDLIRVAVTASHTAEQLDRFGAALRVAMKRAGVKSKF